MPPLRLRAAAGRRSRIATGSPRWLRRSGERQLTADLVTHRAFYLVTRPIFPTYPRPPPPECDDQVEQQRYKRMVQAQEEQRTKKVARHEEQEEVANAAAWQYLGGDTGSMWMLTDKQLEKQASLAPFSPCIAHHVQMPSFDSQIP